MATVDFSVLDRILEKYSYDETRTIAILQDVQAVYRYLPETALCYIAEKIGISEAQIYGVATFYENFSLHDKGKYVIKCCNGTACHVRRSDEIQAALYEATGMSPDDHVSRDGLFTIERVACLGACSLAPACTVNGEVYASMTPDKMRKLIAKIREVESSEAE